MQNNGVLQYLEIFLEGNGLSSVDSVNSSQGHFHVHVRTTLIIPDLILPVVTKLYIWNIFRSRG